MVEMAVREINKVALESQVSIGIAEFKFYYIQAVINHQYVVLLYRCVITVKIHQVLQGLIMGGVLLRHCPSCYIHIYIAWFSLFISVTWN
jgi:hypothetical protein